MLLAKGTRHLFISNITIAARLRSHSNVLISAHHPSLRKISEVISLRLRPSPVDAMGSVGSPTKAGEADPQLLKAARNEQNRTLVFARLVVIRAFNAYWLCTFFQPDEYFQSLEPAWRLAFGEGSGAWVTWVSWCSP